MPGDSDLMPGRYDLSRIADEVPAVGLAMSADADLLPCQSDDVPPFRNVMSGGGHLVPHFAHGVPGPGDGVSAGGHAMPAQLHGLPGLAHDLSVLPGNVPREPASFLSAPARKRRKPAMIS